VFDVLGKVNFEGKPLRDLLIEVVRYGARPECAWLTPGNAGFQPASIEQRALDHAVAHIVPEHFAEVKTRKQHWIAKAEAAAKDRITKEIAQEAKLSPLPPVVIGGVLVVPIGLLRTMSGDAGRMAALPVEFDGDAHRVHCVRQPFQREPDFADLLSKATPPA
jgi:hypothetical protein